MNQKPSGSLILSKAIPFFLYYKTASLSRWDAAISIDIIYKDLITPSQTQPVLAQNNSGKPGTRSRQE